MAALLRAAGFAAATTKAEQAALLKAARRMGRCAIDDTGYRCGHALCPRCRARKAKRKTRPQLEQWLQRLPKKAKLAHVTVTVACDDLGDGFVALTKSLSKLRRSRLWTRAFSGGEFHVDLKRSSGEGATWNVHAHGIVERRAGSMFDTPDLKARWGRLLARYGRVGQLHVAPVTKLWGAR